MAVNGHFAGMNSAATKDQYEHGIQVINQDQEFKYATLLDKSPADTDRWAQSLTLKVPILRESPFCRFQLPPHLRLRIPVDRKIYTPEPSFWHRIRRHGGG